MAAAAAAKAAVRIGTHSGKCVARGGVLYWLRARVCVRARCSSRSVGARLDRRFHVDEAFACFLLHQTPTFRDAGPRGAARRHACVA
jgi:hypothetical protein